MIIATTGAVPVGEAVCRYDASAWGDRTLTVAEL
jgi:hypothetical protein